METAQIQDQYLQWKEAQNAGYSEGSTLHPKTDVKVTLCFIFHFGKLMLKNQTRHTLDVP